jgi:hypothetical protein
MEMACFHPSGRTFFVSIGMESILWIGHREGNAMVVVSPSIPFSCGSFLLIEFRVSSLRFGICSRSGSFAMLLGSHVRRRSQAREATAEDIDSGMSLDARS